MPRHHYGRHGRRQVLNMSNTVAQWTPHLAVFPVITYKHTVIIEGSIDINSPVILPRVSPQWAVQYTELGLTTYRHG